MTTGLQRLVPEPAIEVTHLPDAYAPLADAPGDRPRIAVCMVSSLDGSIAVAGRSGGLSNEHDAEVLRSLRRHADMVIVGAGTVRDEAYGAPARADQRIGVVTSSGRVDTTGPLFAKGHGFLICTEQTPVPAGVDAVRVGHDTVEVHAAITRLHEMTGGSLDHVLCEGGARLNGALLAADLVDELNLTVSPLLVGGTGPRLSETLTESMHRFRLAQLIVDRQSMLFGRWVRDRAHG